MVLHVYLSYDIIIRAIGFDDVRGCFIVIAWSKLYDCFSFVKKNMARIMTGIITQAESLKKTLLDDINAKHLGAFRGLFLCLHIGQGLVGVGALQLQDADFQVKTISINRITAKRHKSNEGTYKMLLPRLMWGFMFPIKESCSFPKSFLEFSNNDVRCRTSERLRELEQIIEYDPCLPESDIRYLGHLNCLFYQKLNWLFAYF